jgi:hypothetical protein
MRRQSALCSTTSRTQYQCCIMCRLGIFRLIGMQIESIPRQKGEQSSKRTTYRYSVTARHRRNHPPSIHRWTKLLSSHWRRSSNYMGALRCAHQWWRHRGMAGACELLRIISLYASLWISERSTALRPQYSPPPPSYCCQHAGCYGLH